MYFFYYIPVGLDIKRVRRAPVTIFLIAVSVLVFLLYRYMPASGGFRAVNLLFLPSDPNPATALTHAFFHTGWVHLIGNMVYLLIFGRALEDRFGPGRYFLIFALSAMAGAYAHLFLVRIWSPSFINTAVGGASGATSGLLGAFLVRFYFARIEVAYWVFMPLQAVNRAGKKYVPAVIGVIVWFVYQAVYALIQFHGAGMSVAYGVHVGGFLCGILLALLSGAAADAARERYLVRARGYFRRSTWYAAQGQYIKYLERVPGDCDVRTELARAYICAGDYGQAQEQYHKAIRGLLRRGERGRAEEVFSQAIKGVRGFRMDEREFLDLAFGAERAMKYHCAAAAYEHFLQTYPISDQASFVLLRLAGLQKGRLNQAAKAADNYRRIISDFPYS
ncbi:MAG: rhomboid family intramembrane serine protease, partial [Candidatus Latescibacteria bacterium]|nr:rhomboid family intramembrane serine protease [bacterium]MBD3425415.1 rhomboid family intramembrane serine protease [Candidatus Latescibacterota bacterium]